MSCSRSDVEVSEATFFDRKRFASLIELFELRSELFAKRVPTERPVTDFRGRRGTLNEFALATDGDYLYFVWEENLGDIWVMDVVQP